MPLVATLVIAAVGGSAIAQTFSVQSVETNAPDLGNVVSAASGDTVFRVSASTGNVTKVSGAGVRLSTAGTRVLVTVTCTGGQNRNTCPRASSTVTIRAAGTPTGRARALTNFTVSPGPNPPTLGAVNGTNTVSFTVTDIPQDGSRNFYVGADFGIAATGSSGSATSGFSVSIANDSKAGLGRATVFRPIALGVNSHLSFGSVVRPASGSGLVTLNAATGVRTVTGGTGLSSPAPARASYTVTGEGGQTIALTIPSNFTMNGPGGSSLVVTTNHTAASSPSLSSGPGSEGTYNFNVGGSFPLSQSTQVGNYTGTFTVMANYN